MGTYNDLIVFQKADEMAICIYMITDSFPKSSENIEVEPP